MRKYRDYILLFLLILFSSGASTVAVNEEALVVAFGASLLLLFQIRANAAQLYIRAVLMMSAVCILYYFLNGLLDINSWLGLFIRLLFAYNMILIVGSNFVDKWIGLIRFLSIVSIVMFAFQILEPNLFFSVNNLAGMAERENSNSLLFNFVLLHQYRNCGPMWEPGVFAAVLIVTLYLSEIYKRTVFTRYNLPILLALLTTFSTTGYLCLLVLTMIHFMQKRSLRILYYVLFLILVIIVGSFEFVSDKIFDQFYGLNDEISLVENSSEDYAISISRYASFVVDYEVFMERPVLGYGADILTINKNIYFQQYGENINRSSGLMSQLVRFGLAGFFLFFLLMYRSFRTLTDKGHAIGGIILLLLLLFSSPISYSTMIFMLLFLEHTQDNSYSFDQFTENNFIKNGVR